MNKKVIPENTKIDQEIDDNKIIAAKLIIASEELALQVIETEKSEAELITANKKLTIFNKELAFQNSEKEKRAAELVVSSDFLFPHE